MHRYAIDHTSHLPAKPSPRHSRCHGRAAAAIASALLLGCLPTACGGGGSSAPASSLAPTPTALEVFAGDGGNIVSWNPSAGATSHNLYFRAWSGATTADTKISDVVPPFAHGPLLNGVVYSYIVTAVNSFGESPASSAVVGRPTGIVFTDDLVGTPGTPAIGSLPLAGGGVWVGSSEFVFRNDEGVEDVGPNVNSANLQSFLTNPFLLSSLGPNEVLRVHVVMTNLSAGQLPLQSSRFEIGTNSTALSSIVLGSLGTSNWTLAFRRSLGDRVHLTSLSSGTNEPTSIDIFLDPRRRAHAVNNVGFLVTLPNFSATNGLDVPELVDSIGLTVVSLFRNVSDEIAYQDVIIERVDASVLFRTIYD